MGIAHWLVERRSEEQPARTAVDLCRLFELGLSLSVVTDCT